LLVKTVHYVSVVPARAATGVVRAVYDQARAEMGILPDPVTMFSASPDLLTATWAPFREVLLSGGHAPRAVKEAVAVRVSMLNQCPYCVDAHTIMLYGTGMGDFAAGLHGDRHERAGDPALHAVSDWATAMMTRPARPMPAPFRAEQTPELVGTLVEFHFLNRVIDVLLRGTFLPGGDRTKRIARRVAGSVLAGRIRAERAPGAAIGIAMDHPLPADLSWAAPNPSIAAAFAGLAATSDAAAGRVVSAAVRTVLEEAVDSWDGRFPGPSRAWLAEPLSGLSAATEVPTARLALLTALAPFQVTETDVIAFRADHPHDGDLLAVLTWAAFTAARRIGAWSAPSAANPR
jgi:AhpD family alkylhydroperoxidase